MWWLPCPLSCLASSSWRCGLRGHTRPTGPGLHRLAQQVREFVLQHGLPAVQQQQAEQQQQQQQPLANLVLNNGAAAGDGAASPAPAAQQVAAAADGTADAVSSADAGRGQQVAAATGSPGRSSAAGAADAAAMRMLLPSGLQLPSCSSEFEWLLVVGLVHPKDSVRIVSCRRRGQRPAEVL